MPDDTTNAVAKTYEGTSITAKAHIPDADREFVEEVTFKFLQDGEQFEEKTVPVPQDGGSSNSSGGSADASSNTGSSPIVSHSLEAPLVPDDKDSYFLEYHFFYKVKKTDGSTEAHQDLSAQRIEVFPRTAQLKVTRAKDDTPFPGFEFKIYQNGEELSTERTFASDTTNAQDENIPAGSAEFNLGLYAGFRIVQSAPFEVTEEVVGTGRKREVKGALKFRAVFVAPEEGSIKQYVNNDVEGLGQTGIGHEVTIEVGVDPEDRAYVKDEKEVAVHFRVTYGPESGEPVAKSARDDADHPTKVVPVSASDTSVTVEEKEAGVLYEGNVILTGGVGMFKVCLGKAGGDTCLVEISGSDKFLTEETVPADATLELENWRRVHYELMVPDIMQDSVLDPSSLNFREEVVHKLNTLGRQLFIEFVHDATHVFEAMVQADYGSLAPRSFMELPGPEDQTIYVLSGRNWRDLPDGQVWQEDHLGKTLYIFACNGLLKFRTDTEDPQKGTDDFSGAVTEAAASINIEEHFSGFFMPFSGYDSEDGIRDIQWVADISKDDDVCKYTAELVMEEDRYSDPYSVELYVQLRPDGRFPVSAEPIVFTRLSYPDYDLVNETTVAEKDEEDDGTVTLKETVLGKEITLEFEVAEAASEEDPSEEKGPLAAVGLTQDHRDQLDTFFKDLFKDGRETLAASEEANIFSIEVHGKTGTNNRDQRIAEVMYEVGLAYARSYEHDQHVFTAELAEEDSAVLQEFVDGLLADAQVLYEAEGKVLVVVSGPEDTEHGQDECVNAVKDKLQELFDGGTTEFVYHPALDADGEPRQGTLSLADITDILNDYIQENKSTLREWRFHLPAYQLDGSPGPGSMVGPEKTSEQCPMTMEFSVQTHEQSMGEADGKLLAWVQDPSAGGKQLLRLILRGFDAGEDEACLAHGHGDEGGPGDCLLDGEALCAACIAYGRSRNLTVIG